MKFHVKTYGCQMNERDSDAVSALLERHGHTQAEGESDAELIIVNTCSVRGKAEDKAIGKLKLMVLGKKDHPGRVVGAIGCMVQRMSGDLLREIPGLDFAVGTHRLERVPGILAGISLERSQVVDTGDGMGHSADLSGHTAPGKGVSSFVNILYGCDRGCAYCVVPAVRGAEWSRPATEVLAEVRAIAAAGVKEVTLLGQSVMSYGRRNEVWPEDHVSPRGYREPLARLLEAVNDLAGIRRVRFTSGHPSGCTSELVHAMTDLPAICEHLHMPVQSGSDRILRKMGRGYTAAEYAGAVRRLRDAMPGMGITTDVIVGFPTETAEDFEMTRRLMEEITFDNSFIFKYSPRPNTPAAGWTDDVTPDEKMARNKILLADQDRQALAVNSRLAGQVVEVLVEGTSLRNSSRWSGRARTNKIVVFEPGESTVVGELALVKVERATAQTVFGKVI